MMAIIALLCLNFKGHAQQDQVAAVKLGRKLPENFWQTPHQVYKNGQVTTQTLNSFRDRLLILDFWATWCSSCTRKFKYMDSLQQKFGDDVAIVLVNAKSTRDDVKKITATMKRFNDVFMSITADTLLGELFPHTSVPHYVWIACGNLLGTTGSDFFQKSTLEAILARQKKLKTRVQ